MRFGVPRPRLQSCSIGAPLDFDIAERLDFSGSKARVRKHGLRLANGKFKKRLDPFLFADQQKLCAMKIQHQRNFEQLSGTESNVGMRERPMRMDDVGPELAADFNALEEPANDIGDRQKLQPGLIRHLAGSAFFVRQEFPACRRVTESVDLHAVNFVTLQPLVRRRQNLDIESRFFQVRNRGTQPRDFGVFVKARINRADD